MQRPTRSRRRRKSHKGPLAGLEGELVILNGKSKVAVRLDKLGYAHVDMPVGFVEKKKKAPTGAF